MIKARKLAKLLIFNNGKYFKNWNYVYNILSD